MYYGILHLHVLVVILFLVSFFIKTILLLLPKATPLEKYRQKTRFIEMYIGTVMLLSGIYLWINTGLFGTWIYVKLIMIVVAVVVSVMAFRRHNKVLAVITLFAMLYVYGISETKTLLIKDDWLQKKAKSAAMMDFKAGDYDPISHGKVVYESYCISCHGPEGNLTLSGAAKLSESKLSSRDMKHIIREGKLAMPAYKEVLNQEEVDAVAAYAAALK